MLEAELKKHEQVKLVATVHAETSTGVLQPLGDIARLAQEHDALFMVDAVTSLGGTEVTVDELGIDYCYSATQKCIGCPPGLSPAALSPKGHEAIRARQQKPASWYLDLGLIANYWAEEHVYHHTAPVSMILGLREGLRMALEEGLEERYARHARNAASLRAGLEALGLDLVVTPGEPAEPDNARVDPRGRGRPVCATGAAAPVQHRDRQRAGTVCREGVAHRADGGLVPA